jgi:hypothetical protein
MIDAQWLRLPAVESIIHKQGVRDQALLSKSAANVKIGATRIPASPIYKFSVAFCFEKFSE